MKAMNMLLIAHIIKSKDQPARLLWMPLHGCCQVCCDGCGLNYERRPTGTPALLIYPKLKCEGRDHFQKSNPTVQREAESAAQTV